VTVQKNLSTPRRRLRQHQQKSLGKKTQDPVVVVVSLPLYRLLARGGVTTAGARRVRALERPRVLIHAASEASRSIHALKGHIGGTDLSSGAPFLGTLLALASIGTVGNGNRVTPRKVALIITRSDDPRRRGATAMGSAVVEETSVRRHFVVAVGSVALIKGTGSGMSLGFHGDVVVLGGHEGLLLLLLGGHLAVVTRSEAQGNGRRQGHEAQSSHEKTTARDAGVVSIRDDVSSHEGILFIVLNRFVLRASHGCCRRFYVLLFGVMILQ